MFRKILYAYKSQNLLRHLQFGWVSNVRVMKTLKQTFAKVIEANNEITLNSTNWKLGLGRIKINQGVGRFSGYKVIKK